MESYLVAYSLLSKKMTLYYPNNFLRYDSREKIQKTCLRQKISDSSLKSRKFHSGAFPDE